MIHIEYVNEDNWREIVKLSVNDEQKEFIPEPIEIIAQGYIRREANAKVYAVVNESEYIGTAMTFEIDEYDGFPPRYLFAFLMIDKIYQNKGFGTKAIEAIIAELKAEKKYDYVEICVDKANQAAFHVYTKIGFAKGRKFGYPNPWDTDDSNFEPDCINLLYKFD